MTKPPRKTRPGTPSRLDLDSWLFATETEPDLLTLLRAYRDAAELLRQADQTSKTTVEAAACDGDASEPDADASEDQTSQVVPRGLPTVPRLHSVPDIDADDLARLHGQLVANGFATVEILGRADGLAYRLTRDGVRQLSDEAVTAEAA